MGFDVNFSNKPIIKEAQSMQNDGGAGNLGYFEQGEKEKKAKDKSIFSEETDSFKKSGEPEEVSDDFSISNWIAKVILAVKDWFRKTFFGE